MLNEGSPVRAVVNQDANTFCVALWLEVGPHKVLLGSDLTPGDKTGVGWVAVVDHAASMALSSARVIKVPHHGAPNGDSAAVWRDMLGNKPIAVLTPYGTGRVPRPAAADVKRLKSRGAEVYSTVQPRSLKPKPRAPSVEKTVKDVLRNRRLITRDSGHVRVRGRAEDLVVELFDGAVQLALLVLLCL